MKRDMKSFNIPSDELQAIARTCDNWRAVLSRGKQIFSKLLYIDDIAVNDIAPSLTSVCKP